MFFNGTLQDGIAAALSQSKHVFCFVTDDQGESRLWETVYLRDKVIAALIESKTVALRLEAGSQEAGYLAAIFPLPKTPTVVIVKNGDLKEYLAAGTIWDDFKRRVTAALSGGQDLESGAVESDGPASGPSVATEDAVRPAEKPAAEESSGQATPSSSAEDQQGDPAQSTVDRVVAQTLAERAARLTAQRKAAAEAEAARKREKAKGKAKAAEDGGDDSNNAENNKAGLSTSETQKHAEMLRRKKQEDADARKRIQKMIDDDKAARRAAQAERLALRELEKKAALGLAEDGAEEVDGGGDKHEQVADPSAAVPPGSRTTESCALQVRMLDGSSLRNRFTSSSSLQEVRKWVDEARQDGNHPYSFKLILTPLPNRTLEVTEEHQSLASLSLCPSATLVLVPVERYSVAYADATGGPVSRLIAYITAFFTWLMSLLSAFYGSISFKAGPSEPNQPTEQQSAPRQPGSSRSGTRKQQHREPNEMQKDYQLYNGNSLNFEPRKDEEEGEAKGTF